MEDTQDKVRRNLVVFSAAIVIGWFLNLKLTAITKLFAAAADIDNVDTGRLWIVTLVVLIYLFLRYRFDTPTSSQIIALRDDLKAQRKNYLFKYLTRKVDQINRTGTFLPIFGSSLSETIHKNKEEYEKEHSQNFSFRLYASNPWSEASPVESNEASTIWDGTIGIAERYFKEGNSRNFATHSGQDHDFSIPMSGRIWIRTHSIIHVISYSKSAVDLIVPMILAGLASLITACKLIAIYSN